MDIRKWETKYSTDCRLKYNSENTHKAYENAVSLFLNEFKNFREPKEIPTDKIKEWLLRSQTINTRKHKLCAVKSFYEITVGMPAKISKIPYPKKDRKLPIVLSQSEIQKMFDVCDNLKHKVIISLLYSCGLRVSELLNLQWKNIDRGRMIINILQAKGKKDRQVPLDPSLIDLLEKYYYKYKPSNYVLNGEKPNTQYTSSSVNQVLKQLSQKAGICNKRVYAHLMRHTSATHMVEAGMDINLIQRLLGHNSVKTTNIYLHISNNLISKLQTPLASIQINR